MSRDRALWPLRGVVDPRARPSTVDLPLRASALAVLVAALAASLTSTDAAVAQSSKTRAAARGAARASTSAGGASARARPDPKKAKPAAKTTAKSKSKPKGKTERRGRTRADRHRRGQERAVRGPSAEAPRRLVPSLPILDVAIRCPPEMVAVAGRVCVDRYEATLVDAATGAPVSPYYPPSRALAEPIFAAWTEARAQAAAGSLAELMPIPPLDPEARRDARAVAASLPASIPNGYLPGHLAAEACAAAGKRLCREEEWVTACRGQDQTRFPYGASFADGLCNVFREEHPAHLLHGSASAGHTDPRLNQVTYEGRPLLRLTGATPSCASRWGDDAILDMVGNLDEWIEDPEGTFVGGFYSRATRNGCDARVGGHPLRYFDYSTGVRCCKDPEP